nr:hypothetical protein [Tanacetum cinerariifolium]
PPLTSDHHCGPPPLIGGPPPLTSDPEALTFVDRRR